MKIARNRGVAGVAALTLALSLAACSDSNGGGEETTEATDTTETTETDGGEATGGGDLAGITINGSGASAQVNAQQAWRDNFSAQTGAIVNYDSTGSGTGRDQFIAGEVHYTGTDSMLSEDEIAGATDRCGSEPIELPLYISPIAVAFNLEGIDTVNMTADILAQIFNGDITEWNDPALVEINGDIELPEQPIIPVNRADDSGTTDNFQEYLAEASDLWTHEPSDTWPISGTQSAEQTAGVVNLVKTTPGAITYADASQIGDLGTVAVEVAGEFLEYSPEAAAAIVDGSEPTDHATDRILTVDLKRDGSIPDAYPIVLISYLVACTEYPNADEATVVKEYFTYMASAEGQEAAAQANGGNAPISDSLREQAMAAIDQIQTN